MKNRYGLSAGVLIVFLGVVSMVSCEKKTQEPRMITDRLLLDTDVDTLSFVDAGGEKRVSIYTTLSWEVEAGDDSWCIAKRTGSLLSVTAETNWGQERTVVVKVKAGRVYKDIMIRQGGIPAGTELEVSTDKIDDNCLKQTAIKIRAVSDWEIEIPMQDTVWCKILRNRKAGIMVSFRGNEERQTEIAIVTPDTRKTISVIQRKYNFTYQKGELYQEENGEFSGIIFQNDGRKLGIISLSEYSGSFMPAGDPDLGRLFGFTTSSGALQTVKGEFPDTWKVKFPAMAWADALNARYETSGWVLVNTDDQRAIHKAYYNSLQTQNGIISQWGGAPFIGGSRELMMTVRERKYADEDYPIQIMLSVNSESGLSAAGRLAKVYSRAVKYVDVPR